MEPIALSQSSLLYVPIKSTLVKAKIVWLFYIILLYYSTIELF